MPDFVFATCRAGSEAALKREVAARHGDLLTPAFMRPHLITWKARQPLPEDFDLGAVFAGVSGRSLGTARTVAEVLALMPSVGEVHVFPRLAPEDGLASGQWEPLEEIRKSIEEQFVRSGDLVLDVIIGELGEPWLVGTHRPSLMAHPDPGALPRVTLPEEAPSRAWLKMEQALAWGRFEVAGKVVLELGCAPGGGSYSLLQRGAKVIGVDAGAMDPRVLAFPNFTHMPMPAGEYQTTVLPQHVDIIVSDMNLEPNIVLNYVEFLCGQMEPSLLILTLKMNDAKVEAQVPGLLKRIQHFGPRPVRAKQLPANRRDICVLAGRLTK